MKVDYRIVIEPQEFEAYNKYISKEKIIILPFSNLGLGGIPARNFVWEHSFKEGHKRHWILDDNIRWFYYFSNNKKVKATDNKIFKYCEDFVDRYKNVPMSGMQYQFFTPASIPGKKPPFYLNDRVYSCILLSNNPEDMIMWRGRYNEDTDLSLRFLKRGDCTILFNAFLCGKMATMRMKGGNTDQLYKQDTKFDGRYEMAKSLVLQHPDVTTITYKWGRYQHKVDYRPFKKNKLIKI